MFDLGNVHYHYVPYVVHTLTEVAINHTSQLLCYFFCNAGKSPLFYCVETDNLDLIRVNFSFPALARKIIKISMNLWV